MNERIHQLAEQSGFNISNDPIDGHDFKHEIEKFAELIVKECAEIADEERPNSLGCGYITKTKGRLMREHFGVNNE
jgi:hypothetical protein